VLELALGIRIESGLGEVDGGDGVSDSILDGV
jgi:hypothetical protein